MKIVTTVTMMIAIAAMSGLSSLADQRTIRGEAVFITDFIEAEDGALDSPNDLILDLDRCDGVTPNPVYAPDGHQLTLGELKNVKGRIALRCGRNATHVDMRLSGLIPNGVYTIWLLTFEAPGFDPTFAHLIGEGSLGPPDGSRNSFVASASGRASLSVRQPAGALSEFGHVGPCLFDEFEFHLVGVYHPDGMTYGPTPGPADAPNIFCYFIEHFGFSFLGGQHVDDDDHDDD